MSKTKLFAGIARKTNSTSELGAKIDSIADLTFVIVSFVKILPTMNLVSFAIDINGQCVILCYGGRIRI